MNSKFPAFRVIRDVTQKECHWLHRDIKKGEEVYGYTGPTYGCVSYLGIAVSAQPDRTLFFELPADSLKRLD